MEEQGAWCGAMALCRSIRESILSGQGPSPGCSDWNVTKASLEVLVRWGIYQALSPGVGIHLKRDQSSSSSSSSRDVSSAILDYSRQVLLGGDDDMPDEAERMFETAEFLRTVAVDSSANASNIRELVLSHHLPDLWAACLELAFGPSLRDSRAPGMLDKLVKELPVKRATESIFVLLAQENCPGWFKLEAGKVLSRLVMRDGGVAAILEVLVGNAPQGNVPAQRKVATQLARSPKYIATTEDYYRNISPQVLQLLSLRSADGVGGAESGESGARIVSNIHHTAVLIACLLATKNARYTEEFLVTPLLEELTGWARNVEDHQPKLSRRLHDSILQTHALITAGHDEGNLFFRRTISPVVRGISPKLAELDRALAIEKPAFFQDEDFSEAEFKAALNDVLVALVVQPIEQRFSDLQV